MTIAAGKTVTFGEGPFQIRVTPDKRGGVMIEGDTSLHLHPASGTRVRVVVGDEEVERIRYGESGSAC
jgi:hypothetical protein